MITPLLILLSFNAFATQELLKSIEPPFIVKDSKSHISTIPCIVNDSFDIKTNYKSIKTVAYQPVYDEQMRLISHNSYATQTVDSNFQDTQSSRAEPFSNGFLAHNSVVKFQCSDGFYLATNSNANEFYGKCDNGKINFCNFVAKSQNVSGKYSSYTGNDGIKQQVRGCLATPKTQLPVCRQMCDITKFVSHSAYKVKTPYQTFDAFNGITLHGAPSYIKYYVTPPQNNIQIECAGNLFLSHSTSPGQHKQFTVSCNSNGYVEYPNNVIEDVSGGHSTICVANKACTVPNSSSHRYGTFRNGNLTFVNTIPHGGNIFMYCNQNFHLSHQHMRSCLNGTLFPPESVLCK